MRIYFEGMYYSADSSKADLLYLQNKCPEKYRQLFPKVMSETKLIKGNSVYQVYFDERSKESLDNGFMPYKNGVTHNYENDVILDIWRRRDWINADYVGVVSWRFYEKTGLSSADLKPKSDIMVIFPQNYEKYEHPFSRKGYISVDKMVQLADKHKLFQFKLKRAKIKQQVWCNYWIARPEVFDEYCTNYLSKAVEFFKDKPEYELMEMHRGKLTPAMTFFLEGLFSVFLSKSKYTYEVKRNTVL